VLLAGLVGLLAAGYFFSPSGAPAPPAGPAPASLSVRTVPDDATVYLDGRRIGRIGGCSHGAGTALGVSSTRAAPRLRRSRRLPLGAKRSPRRSPLVRASCSSGIPMFAN